MAVEEPEEGGEGEEVVQSVGAACLEHFVHYSHLHVVEGAGMCVWAKI